jgi:branched-chain amino acid transport system substrate-binding protein
MIRSNLINSCLFLLLFFCLNSCSLVNFEDSKVLVIAVSNYDYNLAKQIQAKFGKRRINLIKNVNEAKALNLLHTAQVDAYIGSLEIPSVYKTEISEKLLARDAIAVVVHPSNTLNNLSTEYLKDIFSRKINNWKSLCDLQNPLVVIDRSENNLNQIALYNFLYESSSLPYQVTMVADQDRDVIRMISKFPNSISMMSFRSINEAVKTISINNLQANKTNIEKGYYPLARSINIYTPQTKNSIEIQEFMEFIYSQKAQDLIKNLMYMPLSAAELQLVKTKNSAILIGVAAPMEDLYTDLGKSILEAASMAKDKINSKGGINGRMIEIIACNDKAQIDTALDCANKFVKANVYGVIGHLTSQTSIEASKIYSRYGIVQISPASTHPLFTERPELRGFVYRTIGRDDQQARLMSELITRLPGTHPLRVSIFGNNTLYSSTLATMVEAEIQKINIDKVAEIKTIKQGQSQHQNEIKNFNSQVLVFIGEYGEAAQIVKELALANKKDVVFIGADGVYSKRFIQEAGLRAENTFVTGNSVNERAPDVINFVQEFKSKYKSEPSAFAMNSYDAMMILIDAIKSVENKQFETIGDALKATEYKGLTGLIKFNEIGDLVFPGMCVYQVKQGRFEKLQ